MFRLGTLYQVDYFRDQALSRLKATYPTHATRTAVLSTTRIEDGTRFSTNFECINFARETGLLWILPYAFGRMYQIIPSSIFAGLVKKNDEMAVMSSSDQIVSVDGHQRLRAAEAEEMWGTLLSGEHPCGQSTCQKARLKLANMHWLSAIMLKQTSIQRPLRTWNADWGLGLCHKCSIGAQTEYEAGRERLWEKLPSYFGLPPWNELLTPEVSLTSPFHLLNYILIPPISIMR